MSQRLAELHRQRRLVEEHLAWLNREIAAELIGVAPKPAPTAADAGSAPASATAGATTTTIEKTANSEAETTTSAVMSPLSNSEPGGSLPTEALIDEYRTSPDALRNEVRKGCFLYLGLAFGLLIFGIAILYLLFRL